MVFVYWLVMFGIWYLVVVFKSELYLDLMYLESWFFEIFDIVFISMFRMILNVFDIIKLLKLYILLDIYVLLK